ncbi:hypothetical protein SAMD00019534_020300 [Acytostelium subglobosum LB1]|uniref:hypothetical protein n=1 Tax=Acytostelium subglobosum LB1 TaxID=1410327 RepID=UPI000644C12E|nr:hypothetical protein SAMD00019534_020300 [Acytostelium subglobosum LB1]GAM18855.1 hypothetical protein SAMD00019534_020300 [Acytostelium subglobosum LB1]|eukprot:XP_012758075.1 hypothetical protein SAMD00019534_020300 [Acytostelium subglobosum LB1]
MDNNNSHHYSSGSGGNSSRDNSRGGSSGSFENGGSVKYITSPTFASPKRSAAQVSQSPFGTYTDPDDLLLAVAKHLQVNEKKLVVGEDSLFLNVWSLDHLCLYMSGKRVSFKLTRNQLLDTQYTISLIKRLKVISNIPKLIEKAKDFDLTPFESLTSLELNSIKPYLITDIQQLSNRLTKLTLHESLFTLDELIQIGDAVNGVRDTATGRYWSRLATLDCSFNYIPKIDQSIQGLVALEKLNLEGNLITTVENLQECVWLKLLNLSYNKIESTDRIFASVGMVTHLSLRANLLTTVDGLNKLFGLEYLDISYNQIKDMEEMFKLRGLPQLVCLNVEGNPFANAKHYRAYILSTFFENDMDSLESREFYLDGIGISDDEAETMRKSKSQSLNGITTSRSNRIGPMREDRSKPGFYIAPNAVISKSDSKSSSPYMASVSSQPNHPTSPLLKRVVSLDQTDAQASQAPVVEYNEEVKEKDDKFAEEKKLLKDIETWRKEGQDSWLSILNERMQETGLHHQQPQYQHHKVHPLVDDSRDGRKVKIIKKKVKKVDGSSPVPTTATHSTSLPTQTSSFLMARPEGLSPLSAKQLPQKQQQQWTSPKFNISSPIVASEPKVPELKLQGQVFKVTKFGINQEILLEIKSDTLSEYNPKSANLLMSNPLSAIIFVKKLLRANKGIIEITYGRKFKDGLPESFDKEAYLTTDDEQTLRIDEQLRPHAKEYTMRCVDCSEKYVCQEVTEFSECPKCKSRYLFFVPHDVGSLRKLSSPTAMSESWSAQPSAAITSTVLKTSSSLIGALANEPLQSAVSDDDLNNQVVNDLTLQQHFRNNLFDSQESYIYIMHTYYITYNNQLKEDQQEERPIFFLLTTRAIYLLKAERKALAAQDVNFSRIRSIKLKELRKVNIGLLYQSFSIELSDVAYVFLKRSHESNHKLLDSIFEATKKAELSIQPTYKNNETMSNIESFIDSRKSFELYIMLFQRVSSKLQPRSLIIESDRIYIMIENYNQWPLLNRSVKTTSPQFTLVKSFKITDISCLHYSLNNNPTEVTIIFENANIEGIHQWILQCAHQVESTKIVSVLSKLWRRRHNNGANLRINDW